VLVPVVSGVRGMRVRGISSQIPVHALSPKWRLSLEEGGPTASERCLCVRVARLLGVGVRAARGTLGG
jgi:hypothetical protein